MLNDLRGIARKMVLAVMLASSLATAAFAFNATVHAKQDGCCLLIASCLGDSCANSDGCGGDYCCEGCDP